MKNASICAEISPNVWCRHSLRGSQVRAAEVQCSHAGAIPSSLNVTVAGPGSDNDEALSKESVRTRLQ